MIGGERGGRDGGAMYIEGSFWVSRTAAMGMPKLEAGPQKSAVRGAVSFRDWKVNLEGNMNEAVSVTRSV